jgi:hypothetical protein
LIIMRGLQTADFTTKFPASVRTVDRIKYGEWLSVEQPLTSCNGQYTLFLQDDANFRIVKKGGETVYTNAAKNKTGARFIHFNRADNDIEVFDSLGSTPGGKLLWRTGHSTKCDWIENSGFYLGDDGNAVFEKDDVPVWESKNNLAPQKTPPKPAGVQTKDPQSTGGQISQTGPQTTAPQMGSQTAGSQTAGSQGAKTEPGNAPSQGGGTQNTGSKPAASSNTNPTITVVTRTKLTGGDSLNAGQKLIGGRYTLEMQTDGNLVTSSGEKAVVWAIDKYAELNTARLKFGRDGSLSVVGKRDNKEVEYWTSDRKKDGPEEATLSLRDDNGVLEAYKGRDRIWTSINRSE